MTEAEELVEQLQTRRRKAIRETVLEASGAALIVAGVALWSIPAAFIVAGVALLVIVHPIPIRRKR